MLCSGKVIACQKVRSKINSLDNKEIIKVFFLDSLHSLCFLFLLLLFVSLL